MGIIPGRLVFACPEVSMFHGGTKSCGNRLKLKNGSVYRLIMYIGADSPFSFSLKCFELHVVKFQLDEMEPRSQLAAQKKVQENSLGTRRYFEKRVV